MFSTTKTSFVRCEHGLVQAGGKCIGRAQYFNLLRVDDVDDDDDDDDDDDWRRFRFFWRSSSESLEFQVRRKRVLSWEIRFNASEKS